LAVLVAERVAKVPHPYFGPDVEVRLWSPLDDAEVLNAASCSTAVVTRATVKNESADPVVFCVKKRSADPVPVAQSFTDGCRIDDGESRHSLEQNPSVDIRQSQTGIQSVSTRCKPRQQVSSATSDVGSSRTSSLSVLISADSEVQFRLLKQLLENGFAREHRCEFTCDEGKWTVTVVTKDEECLSLLREQLYEYKDSGTFEVEVGLSPRLSRVLYDRHRQWLYDRLCRRVKDTTHLVMSNDSDSRLAVAAFSQNTAQEGAKTLRACLLRGTVPLTDSQHVLASSTKVRKQINKIVTSKVVDVKTGAREIIVDGLPRDVVYAVSEIDRYLNK